MMIKEKLISAFIGTMFFAIFQPFGISQFGMTEKFLITCGLFFVAFAACMTCEGIVKYVLRMPHDTKRGPNYMMKRGLVFQLFNVIVLTVYVALYFDRFLNNELVDNNLSMEHFLAILAACVGCCFFIGLYWRNVYWKRHYAKQLEEAQLLNGVLMERARVATSPSNSSFSGESSEVSLPQNAEDVRVPVTLEGNTKENVSLQLSDFLFAESEGNYVSVHHLEDEEERQTMLRTSMKSVIATLCTDNDIMQCHRAYIVNLSHVESVEGRSSGIGLRLHHCETVVPVSKSYVNEIKERIKNPR